MKIYGLVLGFFLSFSLSIVSGQNQPIHDIDHIFTIDLSQLDTDLTNRLKEIRYVSVLNQEDKKLILKSSQDKSTKAREAILTLISNKSAILEQTGLEYREKQK